MDYLLQTGLIIAIGIIFFLLVLIMTCYLWISRYAARYIFSDPDVLPFRETALVLGTAKLTPGGKANYYFNFRMDAAALLFHEKKCNLFIVSGADKLQDGTSEADEMKEDLMARGLPPEIIIVDRAGFRTWDSLWRCRGSFGRHTLTVVSQKFHIERAIFIGHRQGLHIIGFRAEAVKGKTRIRMFIRECLARVKCIMDCYFIHPKPVYMKRIRRRHFRRRKLK